MPRIDTDNNKRITGLDVYRVLACIFVVTHHCNSKVMMQVEPKSLAWFLLVIYFFISKTAVQGFLMIAGYNLLHKEDTPAKARKRVIRILGVLVVFSLIYYIWESLLGYGGLSIYGENGEFIGFFAWIWNYLKTLVSTPITDSFWYLYMYLGLMIVMPFLQKLVKNMKDGDYIMFLGLSGIFAFGIPTLQVLFPGLTLASDFQLPAICMSVTYLLIGHLAYCIQNYHFWVSGDIARIFTGARGNLILIAGFFIGLVSNILIVLLEYSRTGGENFLSIGEINCLPLALESICLFALLMRIKYSVRFTKLVTRIAPLTFGIYLFSDMMCTFTHYIYYYLCQYMNRLFAVTIQGMAAIVLCGFIVWALRFIPFVKKAV